MNLVLYPISREDANAFITQFHRHHKAVVGDKFRLAIFDGEKIRGVCIVGRPVSRVLAADMFTLEVTRCCTDGVPNGCSKLYRAAWRVALNLGYRKLITYILSEEHGGSLKGAGFRLVGTCKGTTWHTPSRPRTDKHPITKKTRWEITA